ncbi:MAG: M56 family metallopeptidase [Verrucomicrobiales bacterium]|nr:M56 family metallopeptidase [Verrucomicrobiales bacterium]
MSDFAALLIPTLFWGSIQLAVFGGVLLLHERTLNAVFSPAIFCTLIVFIFIVSIFPETIFHDPRELYLFGGDRFWEASFWIEITSICWLSGFLIFTLATFYSIVRNHNSLVRIPMLIRPALLELVERLKSRLKLWVPVTLYESSSVSSPMLYGWVRPRIFLPLEGGEDAGDNVEFILAHECMHIRRRDIFWQWVVLGTALVFWFHPFSWLLLRRFKESRELACDDSVLKFFDFDSGDYASALLSEARRAKHTQSERPFPVYAGIIEKSSQIQTRVQHIMNPKSPYPFRHFITGATACAILVTSLFITQLRSAPSPGFSESERTKIEEQAEAILKAIWNKRDAIEGYEYASSYYKSSVSLEQYRAAMESPQISMINITSRKLTDISELTGPEAVEGMKNAQLSYKTMIEGTDVKLNESLFLVLEDGKWLMSGHWIRP